MTLSSADTSVRFDILTIFPGYFASPLSESLIERGIDKGLLDIRVVDLRDFSEDPHRKVDDEPYGGGPGMVLSAQPVIRALEAFRSETEAEPPWVVHLSPRGRRFDFRVAREYASRARIAMVCGRYEGIDERVAEAGLYDDELSLGDFVLFGGEVVALAVLEAVARFVPGVVGDAESVACESFEDGLLDTPHYTRPRELLGIEVPEILLSGHHERIRRWRRKRQLLETRQHRPDLLARVPLSAEDRELLLEPPALVGDTESR